MPSTVTPPGPPMMDLGDLIAVLTIASLGLWALGKSFQLI